MIQAAEQTRLSLEAGDLAVRYGINLDTVRLLRSLPGYDPFAQAGECRFDADAAWRAVEFFRTQIKHVKGERAGKSFALERWQTALVANLLGWILPDGTRRYRECLLYVPKKNGKTAWAAGLLLYMLTEDGEQGAEIYSAASSREQASLVFSHATGMVKQNPRLRKLLKLYGDKGGSQMRSILFEEQLSSYRCLAADVNTVDGANPHFSVIDELHRHKSPDLANLLQASTGARRQPLTLYTTTADYNRPSLCNTMLAYAKSVRENDGDTEKPGYDPAFLPVVFETPKDADWQKPEVWRAANPNLDVTISEEFVRRECQKAMESPTKLNDFLRLRLNIVTDADVAWLTMAAWDACAAPVDLGELEGAACWAGLDMASTSDLTAFVLLFPEHGNALLPFFWVPGASARKRERLDRVPYLSWIAGGLVEQTGGNVTDYDVVRARINEIGKRFNVREIAIDRWNSTQLQTQLIGDGFEVVPFGQGFASMAAPTKEFERLMLECNLRHGGNPVLRWMAGNVMVESDAAGNIKPSKKKSVEKIDGIVAGIMALGRAMVREEATGSVYETRGLLTV